MATQTAGRTLNAVVVSAGLMQKTVKVRVGTQKWDSYIRKVNSFFFSQCLNSVPCPENYLSILYWVSIFYVSISNFNDPVPELIVYSILIARLTS
jgi:hypothetical protein